MSRPRFLRGLLAFGCVFGLGVLPEADAQNIEIVEEVEELVDDERPMSPPVGDRNIPQAKPVVGPNGRLLMRPQTGSRTDGGQPAKVDAPTTPGQVLDEIRGVLKNRPGNAPVATGVPEGITLMWDRTNLGRYYENGSSIYYLSGSLWVQNDTDKPITIDRKQVRLSAQGKELPHSIAPSIGGASYTVSVPQRGTDGKTTYKRVYVRLSEVKKEESLTVKPGEEGRLGIVFSSLGFGAKVPPMTLRVPIGEAKTTLNLTRIEEGRLAPMTERIGPRGAIALITLGGELNLLNWDILMDELDRLVTQVAVSRIVITWTDDAPPAQSEAYSWMQQAFSRHGRPYRGTQSYSIPPASIVELHAGAPPNMRTSSSVYNSSNSPTRIHKTLENALAAALITAIPLLEPQEIVQTITQGKPVLRPVMLSLAGSGLRPVHLPIVLRYASGDDVAMRRAALRALRHFPQPAAIEALTQVAGNPKASAADRASALESLATSRFGQAHDIVQTLLASEQVTPSEELVAVLVTRPHPMWKDLIVRYLEGSPGKARGEALKALIELGHPRLTEFVTRSLKGGDQTLQDEVLGVMSRQGIPSELIEVAANHVVTHLQAKPPTNAMLSFLAQHPNQDALPSLLKQVRSKPDKTTSYHMRALGAMLNREVEQTLVEVYFRLPDNERDDALRLLWKLNSPHALAFAKQALRSKNSTLINVACDGLRSDASSAAVDILVNALKENDNTSAWSYICNTLVAIGTPPARTELRKLRRTVTDKNKLNYVKSSLRNMHRSTPAYSAQSQAKSHLQSKKYDLAIKAAEIGLEMDNDFPEFYRVLGTAYSEKGEFEKALKYFEETLKRDYDDDIAIALTAIAQVQSGKVEQGLTTVQERLDEFKTNSTYLYNTACVYGRAYERATAKNAKESLAQRKQEFLNNGIDYLKQAKEKGFKDFELMKKDPDLKPLAAHPEFRDIVPAADKPMPRKKPNL